MIVAEKNKHSEIGKLGPLELWIDSNQKFIAMSTTSGLAEFNGYKVERTPGGPSDADDKFTLSTNCIGYSDQKDKVVGNNY